MCFGTRPVAGRVVCTKHQCWAEGHAEVGVDVRRLRELCGKVVAAMSEDGFDETRRELFDALSQEAR